MTNEEIEQLLVKSEKSLQLEVLSVPLTGGTVSLGAIGLGIFFVSWEGLLIALLLAFVSLCVSLGHRAQWLEIRTRRAELIWKHLARTVFGPRANGVTAVLIQDITAFYGSDPRGETLPLSQAIRLVQTHHKQQQRLEIVLARGAELRVIGEALQEKTHQLRALGEVHGQGETRLQSLREDEGALQTLSEQIKASCHRLELILIEARKAGQMRQLHREISALSQKSLPSAASSSALTPESLFDIERQITREVETFLQLERESDRHLREI